MAPGRGNSNNVRSSAYESKAVGGSDRTFTQNLLHNARHDEDKNSSGAKLRGHLVAFMGEFVGTFLFLFFAFAWHQIVANQTTPQNATDGSPSAEAIMYISLGYGFSLLVSVWCFYRVSGGLFNPAVLFCLVVTKNLPFVRSLFLFPAEILGGIAASAVVSGLFPFSIATVNTALSSNTSTVRGVFIEMFLTSLLCFTILMLAAEKSKATFMAPLAIGLALFVAELAGVFYTGGSLNPTRSFGPAVISGVFPRYHWIYWIGPLLGAGLASGFYAIQKGLHYEDANPGQDSAGGDFHDV